MLVFVWVLCVGCLVYWMDFVCEWYVSHRHEDGWFGNNDDDGALKNQRLSTTDANTLRWISIGGDCDCRILSVINDAYSHLRAERICNTNEFIYIFVFNSAIFFFWIYIHISYPDLGKFLCSRWVVYYLLPFVTPTKSQHHLEENRTVPHVFW